ncbi:MAG: hypothetical protein ABFS86_00965 [Planctomycetota bacterium]
MRRAFIAILALAVVATTAHAGRSDDFEFAQGLMDRKYYDLAKEQFEKIVNDTSRSGEEQAAGGLGLAMLLKNQAADGRGDPTQDPADVLKIFAEAEARFDTFLTDFPNHPKRDIARFEVGGLLYTKGLFLRDLIEKEPEKVAEYRAQAETAFDAAIDLFKEVADNLEEKAENDAKHDWPSRRARFFELAATYDKGMVYEAGTAERQGVLQKCIKMCENFIWDNEENLLGGFAYMYWGLVHRGLDEPADAMGYLGICAELPLPDPDRDGMASFSAWAGLVMQACFKLGEYANELGERDGVDYRDQAIAVLERMQERIPQCWDMKFGHFALLEYARALSGLQRFADARDVVSRISQKGDEIGKRQEWGLATAFKANKLLNEILADAKIAGKTIKTAPSVLFKAASGKMDARQYTEAVLAFQAVVSACETPEQIEEFAMPAWMSIGRGYYLSNCFVEAYYAYDRTEQLFKGKDVAGEAAYLRYRAINARYAETKDPRDLALVKKARSKFATDYKDHPRSIDLQYYEGADLITDGDALRADGKELEAKAIYNDALTRLGNTKTTSILYAKAQARIGELLYKLEKPRDALKKFDAVEAYIADRKNVTTDPNRRANRLQARSIAAYYRARCHKDAKDWTAAAAALDDYETKFPEETSFHAAVKFERLRALLRLDRLAESEAQFANLRKDWPEAAQIPLAARLISSYCGKKRKELKDKDAAGCAEMTRKTAEYYVVYMETRRPASEPTWQEAQLLGSWYFEIDDLAAAEPWLEKALEGLAIDIDTAEGERLVKLELQADGLLQKLAGILLRQKKYGEAKSKLEDLLIPDEGAKKRVLELLKQQKHSPASLKELMSKIRPIPTLMENLARTYKFVGDPDDLLRALTLILVLERADPGNKYTEIGWRRKLLRCEVYLQYGRDFRDQSALKNVIKLINDWESLGVLDKCPVKEELFKVRAEASRLLAK